MWLSLLNRICHLQQANQDSLPSGFSRSSRSISRALARLCTPYSLLSVSRSSICSRFISIWIFSRSIGSNLIKPNINESELKFQPDQRLHFDVQLRLALTSAALISSSSEGYSIFKNLNMPTLVRHIDSSGVAAMYSGYS